MSVKGRAQDRLDVNTESEYGPIGSAERRKNLQKHWNLQKIYGITLATYRIMKKSQGGVCAICKEPETGKHKRGKETVNLDLAVDHDHKTGNVRQLLCHKCNKALGLLKDDPNLFDAASEYLRLHKLLED